MMDRIKKGVYFRFVNQIVRLKIKLEFFKGCESVVDELKGILGIFNKFISLRSLKFFDFENSEIELERILCCRKVIVEVDSSSLIGILVILEFKFMLVLGFVFSVIKIVLNKKILEVEFNSLFFLIFELGEGFCKLEGCISFKVMFQFFSSFGYRKKYIDGEK